MSFDFAIIGNTPKAALLACMLAKTHKKQVALIASPPNKLRPLHGFDISIAPITRPKTWKILKENIGQTIEFLNKSGIIKTYEHVDPLFFATNLKGQTALSHVQSMANAYGFSVEKQAHSEKYISAYKFPDAIRLLRRPFFASLNERLKKCNVQIISPKDIKIIYKKAQMHISSGKEKIIAKQVILVDDKALLNHLSNSNIENNFIKTQNSGFLIEPINKIKNPITYNLDNGITIHQRNDGAIDCLGECSVQILEQEIKETITKNKTVRLAGRTNFMSLKTLDGAPIFGKIARSKFISICNFNMSGFFQTPAIARILSDKANQLEKEYFLALAPKSKNYNRKNITEYSPIASLNGVKK